MSGGKQQPTSTTQTVQNFSPEEAARRATVQAAAERLYRDTAGTISNAPYPGAKPVDFSPETIASRKLAMDYATGPGADFLNEVQKAQKFSLHDVLYPESNPALAASIQGAINPMIRAFSDPGGPLDTIRRAGYASGQFGGTRQQIAEGIAADRLQQNIADTTSKMSSDAYYKGLEALLRSIALAPQTYQTGFTPANIQSAIGTQNEEQAQAVENYNAQGRLWGLNAPWLPIQNWANIVYGGSTPGTSSTTIGSVPQRSTAQGMLGGALGGAGAGSLITLGSGGTLAIPGAILGAILGAF